MKQTLTKLKGKIGSSMIRDFSTRHTIMNRTSRQKFTKEIEDLNNTKLTRSYRYTQNIQKQQNTQSSQAHIKHFPG